MRRIGVALTMGTLVATASVGTTAAAEAGASPTAGPSPTAAAAGFGSDWTVYHGDAQGSGVDPSGTSLSPASAAWTSPALDGQLYGEPLVENGQVYIATENNTVYDLAANTGRVIWSTHIAAPVPSGDLPCGDISPSVGITSTPVIDAARNEIFVVDDQLTGTAGASHHLVGLNLSTGAIELDTAADPPGSHPLFQLQRPGLALDAGQVIVGYGGNAGDCETAANPYHGWLVAVPEQGGAMRAFAVASASGDSQGAIWLGGAAPAVDSGNNIWVSTGNSQFESASDAYDNSDGVLELSSSLALEQSFAPATWQSDNATDFDLGSTVPALMDDGLLLQVGKSHVAFVVSQASPGGVGGQLASASSFCTSTADGGSAVSGQTVYVPCESGIVKTQVTPGTPPTISSVWKTSTESGGPPILAGGLVWTISSGGTLFGLDPDTGAAAQQFSIGGLANHFSTPTVADGLLLAPASNTVHAFAGPAGVPPAPSATVPSAPTGVSAIPGNGRATVSFRAPSDSGGSAVTRYTVTATDRTNAGRGGQVATGSRSPIVITGLTAGDRYTFTVRATNATGPGPASSSNAVAIGPSATATAVTWPRSIRYATAFAVGVHVTSTGGVPTGAVVLRFGAKVLGRANLVRGAATIRVPAATAAKVLGAGRGRRLTVTYNGAGATRAGGGYRASTAARAFAVAKDTPKVTLRYSPARVGAFQHSVANVTISVGTAAGQVRILRGTKVIARGTVRAGKASVRLPIMRAGVYTLHAKYLGSNNLNATGSGSARLGVHVRGTASLSLRLSPARVSSKGRAVAIVKVSGPRPTRGGVVEIVEGRRVLARATPRQGRANLRLPRITKLGANKLQLRFGGNRSYFASTTAAVRLTVVR